MIEFNNVSFSYHNDEPAVFNNLTLSLPDGVVSLVGQNGTGKSSMLLLGGGRLLPNTGKVILGNKDTSEFKDEKERDSHAAFIYQNMEFETQENIGTLLEFVYENGYHTKQTADFIHELIQTFELSKTLNKRTQDISKGELQRVILAFSLLYGTPAIMMDEPIFALEEYQKHRALEYIYDYAKRQQLNIYYSLHELDLTKKYSDYIVLFYKNKPPVVGQTEELFKPEIIEKAYEVPFPMLKAKELLFRDALIKIDQERTKQSDLPSID
ncbi:MAG: ABC transporter ATP-binding protein [Spirochaetales bacterium]|nr:ABC transporter ATP-binding protein [Spirochaetales bacterium]